MIFIVTVCKTEFMLAGRKVKTSGKIFSLYIAAVHIYINEYMAIDSGGYMYEQPLCISCSIWLDASQRS